jgi:hypothetical protein
MRLSPTASIHSFLSVLLLGACVAKDPDPGDLETGNDDGASESGDSTGGSTDEGATTAPPGSEGSEGSETGEPSACTDPALVYREPSACPDEFPVNPLLPAAGCYAPCDGPGSGCTVGTCFEVQINPCVCADGEDCCAACGAYEWLCVEGLSDTFCNFIIGTTFSSVEELECGLGPDGPVLCHWQVTFEEDGDWLWQYSDVGEGGTYTCEGGTLVLSDPEIEFVVDLKVGALFWEGVEYTSM